MNLICLIRRAALLRIKASDFSNAVQESIKLLYSKILIFCMALKLFMSVLAILYLTEYIFKWQNCTSKALALGHQVEDAILGVSDVANVKNAVDQWDEGACDFRNACIAHLENVMGHTQQRRQNETAVGQEPDNEGNNLRCRWSNLTCGVQKAAQRPRHFPKTNQCHGWYRSEQIPFVSRILYPSFWAMVGAVGNNSSC